MSDSDPQPHATLIAMIAAQLFPPGHRDSHDSRKVSEAVALASRIVEQASKGPVLKAYELFGSEAKLSMREIAETFKERGWAKLHSHNPVTNLVRELLEAMHCDIQYRRTLIAAAFRSKSMRIDPEEAEHEACAGIKTLLRNLGMDFMIAQRMDDVASRVWHDLIEEWLIGECPLREELTKTACASTSLFSAICGNSSYDDYIKARRPSETLGADELLAVTLWMTSRLRSQLLDVESRDGVTDKLFRLNLWPEFLYPGDRQISQPFAECIAVIKEEPIEEEILLETFDLGIQRFIRLLGRFMLANFSKKFATEPFSECLDEIKKTWISQDEDEKESLSGLFEVNPLQNIKSILSFSRGDMPLYPVRMPFDGIGVESPVLLSYAQHLDMLLNSLREASFLADRLNVQDRLQNAAATVRAEKIRMIEMSKELKDTENKATQEKIVAGGMLLMPLETNFNLGKINAHLLFRYAAERGLQGDRLVKQ